MSGVKEKLALIYENFGDLVVKIVVLGYKYRGFFFKTKP